MKITGIREIYVMPSEGPDSPCTTVIELNSGDTVILESSDVNYINMSWDDESNQNVADVDVMSKGTDETLFERANTSVNRDTKMDAKMLIEKFPKFVASILKEAK